MAGEDAVTVKMNAMARISHMHLLPGAGSPWPPASGARSDVIGVLALFIIRPQGSTPFRRASNANMH
jgi:hypothetical protein